MARIAARAIGKWAAVKGARCLGGNLCLRTAWANRLLVLCYHGVIPDDLPRDPMRMRNTTRVSDFRGQMGAVARLFTPVSAWEVLQHVDGGRSLPPHSILITFDDGFRNNLTYAAPEMRRLGIPSLVHLTVAHIGQSNLLWTQELDERLACWKRKAVPMPAGEPDATVPDDGANRWRLTDRIRAVCKRLSNEERLAYLDRLREEPVALNEDWHQELYGFLSWDEARELGRQGVALGSHTVTHPILSSLSADALAEELRQSRSRIEQELSLPCPWLAYPNGGANDVSPAVLQAAEEAGYRVGFTLMGRVNARRLQPLAVDRVCVPTEVSLDAFEARLNGLLAWFANRS